MAPATALAEAISQLDVRYGAQTVVSATVAADRAPLRRTATDILFDRLSGGITPGAVVSLTGAGTCGKVTLALRAVSAAQRSGGMGLWVDPTRSFDPLAAQGAGVDLRRLIVVRPRDVDGILLSASAALRSDGPRIVVVDLGPGFAQIASVDELAALLPKVRGSTSALVVVSDHPPRRLRVPTFGSERTSWERRHGRTTGWTFAVRRMGDESAERAVLQKAAV